MCVCILVVLPTVPRLVHCLVIEHAPHVMQLLLVLVHHRERSADFVPLLDALATGPAYRRHLCRQRRAYCQTVAWGDASPPP